MIEPLQNAISKAGGQRALAKAITCFIDEKNKRVSQGQVWQWLHRDKKVPVSMCHIIEAVTGVKREQLRPDIFAVPPKPTTRGRK